ncbi:hypothetical protein DIPPA_29609 [Diplonema papillatum]|nr:hypothetical protein DIPPA_29609 [Diplonema papillatum]
MGYGEERNGRAERWDTFEDGNTGKKGQKVVGGGDPQRLEVGVPRHTTKDDRVGTEHHKVKCETCKWRKATVARCCEGHRAAGDGLAVKYCERHRLT